KGLQHEIIDSAKAGVTVPVEALLAGDVKATKVVLMYRPEGATDFTEVKMTKSGDCKYTAQIPAAAMKGALVHYYVAGTTEVGNMVKNCCLGNPIVVLIPEIGYYVSPQLEIGVAARIGIPVGANVDGHATAAPGGVVRVRYALLASGEGLRFMGQIG